MLNQSRNVNNDMDMATGGIAQKSYKMTFSNRANLTYLFLILELDT